MENAELQTITEYCRDCLRPTNQNVLHSVKDNWSQVLDEERGFSIDGGESWDLMRCLGCSAITVRNSKWHSEEVDEDGRPDIKFKFWPTCSFRQKPKWATRRKCSSSELNDYSDLIDEIYDALAVEAFSLAVMGIRALIERVMFNCVGDKGSFVDTIKEFFSKGYVSEKQQEIFNSALIEAGHAAMHRNFKPSAETVNVLLDIVEGIIASIFFITPAAESVAKGIPKRVGRTPKCLEDKS
jgi:hypothetical protein